MKKRFSANQNNARRAGTKKYLFVMFFLGLVGIVD
jgi:hypothetical protein